MSNYFKGVAVYVSYLLVLVIAVYIFNQAKDNYYEDMSVSEETSTIMEVSEPEDVSLSEDASLDKNTSLNEDVPLDYEKLNEQCLTEGTSFLEINNNTPYFLSEEIPDEVFEEYKELDAYGRCQTARALIGKELMPTEERGSIGQIKPSGWHTVKYNGIVDGNYLYNRCHLIAYCLTGENANKKNLITGTRYLNVEGMLPFETMIAKYMDTHEDNHVYYRVTPIFLNDNLVATGLILEAYSIEDNGSGISFCVYCPNIQPGIFIDYKTGESSIAEERETNNLVSFFVPRNNWHI